MIPSIEEILAGLISGDYTADQARIWIAQHGEWETLEVRHAAHVALAVLEVVEIDDPLLAADAKTACDALRFTLGVSAASSN